MTAANTGLLPKTAKEALELWDKGEPIHAFEVEHETATVEAIYAAAFELIRGGRLNLRSTDAVILPKLTADSPLNKREREVAHSIAYVALLRGWAAMVEQHLADGHIRAMIVQKKIA